jgi:Family of unknown function (DUF5662)
VSDYDSAPDTYRHILRVIALAQEFTGELLDRALHHDASKLQPPEKPVFDEYTPRLAETTYGSPQYRANLNQMGEALGHHYTHNRHHPEHHDQGIAGMNLIDIVEMLADWKAASQRHTDGDFTESLALQRDRFNLDPQLYAILVNTAEALGWTKKDTT